MQPQSGCADLDRYAAQITADGFCVFQKLLPPDEVLAARAELVTLLDQDLEYRSAHGINTADYNRDGFSYSLTPEMHTMLFPAFQSARTAALIERVIANPLIESLLRKIVGEHYRLRVDLVRRASGVDDTVDEFQVPHEWHRDTPGEFTFGIFLDDMTRPFSGGTTAIQGGTHLLPYDPIWDFMLGPRSFTNKANYLAGHCVWIDPAVRPMSRFNPKLVARLTSRVVEMRGGIGDAYFFLNDVWHGRAPNKTGSQFMTIRFGGFPTDFAFKDDLPLPTPRNPLPPRLRAAYEAGQEENRARDLLIHRARHGRPPALYRLAHWEKRLAVRYTEAKAARRDRTA